MARYSCACQPWRDRYRTVLPPCDIWNGMESWAAYLTLVALPPRRCHVCFSQSFWTAFHWSRPSTHRYEYSCSEDCKIPRHVAERRRHCMSFGRVPRLDLCPWECEPCRCGVMYRSRRPIPRLHHWTLARSGRISSPTASCCHSWLCESFRRSKRRHRIYRRRSSPWKRCT